MEGFLLYFEAFFELLKIQSNSSKIGAAFEAGCS